MDCDVARLASEPIEEFAPQRRFRQYTRYVSTEQPWLGEVPAHWRVQPLKRFGWFSAGAGFPDDEQGVQDEDLPFFKVGDMAAPANPVYMVECNNTVSRETAQRLRATIFAPNTIVFAKVGAALLLNRRRVLRKPSCLDNNMMGLTLTEGDTGWFFYRLCDLDFGRLANPGAVPSLNERQLREIVVAVPPVEEQRAIAAFLDRETARIDELIAKKQRLIELLQEKRTALISRAVTKGLNPNAPMKDSGIDWIGKVPEHWNVKQLKFAVTFQRGHDLPLDDRIHGDVPVVTSAGPSAWHNEATARGPGIVTGRYGTIGTFYLVEQNYWPLNTTLYSVNLRGNSVRFLWYMLHSLTDVFLVNAGKSAVPGVDRNDLHPITVAVPPVEEQRAIGLALDAGTRRLRKLARSVRLAIERLQEYRSALISAAVTGKIDVREEVAE